MPWWNPNPQAGLAIASGNAGGSPLSFGSTVWGGPTPGQAAAVGGQNSGQAGMWRPVPPRPPVPQSPVVDDGGPIPSGGGGMPKLEDILSNDDLYQGFLASNNAYGAANRADAIAAMRRAIIQSGFTPELGQYGSGLAEMLKEAVNAQVLGDARANTDAGLSTKARINEAHVNTQKGIGAALAARGAHNSGEYGYQLAQEAKDYDRTIYDTAQRLMEYLSGTHSQYTVAEQARLMAIYQAQQQALADWLARNQSAGGGSTPPSPPPPGGSGGGARPPGPPGGGGYPPGGPLTGNQMPPGFGLYGYDLSAGATGATGMPGGFGLYARPRNQNSWLLNRGGR